MDEQEVERVRETNNLASKTDDELISVLKQPRRWEKVYLEAVKQELEERLSEEEFAAAADKDTKDPLKAIYVLSGIIGAIFAYLTYTYDTTIGLFNNLSSFLFRTLITTLIIATVY